MSPGSAKRPWWRLLLANRYAPYAAVIVFSVLSPALPHTMHPNDSWWTAAAVTIAVTFVLVAAAALRPGIDWLDTLGPLTLLLGIQFLRNADGNNSAGFSSLIYLPVIWFAFYGKRYQVVLAVFGGYCVMILPTLIVGAPQYPGSAWRGTLLFLVVLSTVGPVVQFLVQRTTETNAALAVSEKQFRAAFDDAPVGAILASADGRTVLQVNRALCSILGRSAAEVVGHDMVEFTILDDVADTVAWQRTLKDQVSGTTVEKRYLHRSGRVVWVAISFSIIRDEAGQALNVVSQIEDISLRRESDRALLESLETERTAAEAARAAARTRRDIVSGISHDLRTPITAASGFAELLGEGDAGALNTEQTAMLNTITRNLDRISVIVDDLLALSRTDLELAPRAELVDLGDVVENTVQSISLQATERGLRLRYVNDLRGVCVHGDASRLDRALSNLLSNAVKFTPVDGAINVTAATDGATASIAVEDTGIGIPETDVDKIFNQYFRSSAAREHIAGTGLGLAIVHAVALQHGGHVTVQSKVGEGTTFTLTLPVAEAGYR